MVENITIHQGYCNHKSLFSEKLVVASNYKMILSYAFKDDVVYSYCHVVEANMQASDFLNDKVQGLNVYLEFEKAIKVNGFILFLLLFIIRVLTVFFDLLKSRCRKRNVK